MYKAFKVCLIVWPCLAAALPLQAVGAPPSNAAIGHIEAILNYCAQSNPALAARSQAAITKLSGPTAAAARTTVAYQNAYKSTTAQLATLSPAEAASSCAVLAK